MSIQQLLLILRARYKLASVVLLLTAMSTLVVSILLPKAYKATTSVVISQKGTDPVTGVSVPAQLMPGYVATQVDIIRSKSVALRVVDQLKLTESAEAREKFWRATKGRGDIRNWVADLLLQNLEITPSRESSVIQISFYGSTPETAAAVADTFTSEYQQAVVQLKVEPMRRASHYIDGQIRQLRNNLEAAQSKLSRYQQEKGIVSADHRLDVETARLSDLSSQLVMVQAQLMEALSRQRQAQGSSQNESPDVLADPIVQSLRSALAQAELRFSDVSQKLDVNHPVFQSVKSEVEKLRAELGSQMQAASRSIANNARILQRREAELRAALESQKARVLTLNRARDEIAVLTREVESAQKAYESTAQRLNLTSLEGQSNQADVAVLNWATPPSQYTRPKVLLNTLLSLFLGTMLGLAATFIAEMLDRKVRSREDLEQTLQLPVLGIIQWAESATATNTLWRRLARLLIPSRSQA